ncbi:aldo-keto reductase [Marasmius fiardii PR-910]|nr:aldo-keto reductase [Marasmius fiardii PR-910]
MMDDVLISQLPVPLLRSSLRGLLSQWPGARQIFVDHVRGRLKEAPPPFTLPQDLFAGTNALILCEQFMASTRCLFSSKLATDSLPYLTHLITGIVEAKARWEPDGELEGLLEKACGDIVQAVQALKESSLANSDSLARNQELHAKLINLSGALWECERYCADEYLPYPFTRARLQVDDFLILAFPDVQANSTSGPTIVATDLLEIAVDPATAGSLEYIQLGSLVLPRLLNGLWQLSSPAWGSASSVKQTAALCELMQAGLVATDMADHYGDSELIYGGFRNRLKPGVRERALAATKWCVFRRIEGPVTPELVFNAVQERVRRIKGRIDLLQFHWNNYEDKKYLDVLAELVKLTKTQPHLVSNIGLVNFDAEHTDEVCRHLLAIVGEVGIVSNQVPFSFIDSRPLFKMIGICEMYGIKLLTYGTLCGGFLADKWVGVNSPELYGETAGLTPSQRKYYDVIMTWGSWSDFQTLLYTLKTIADKHGVDVANVATRWVLDRPSVGAVIIGTRLGVSSNVRSNLQVSSFRLDEDDNSKLEEVALGSRARRFFDRMGDCGTEYRMNTTD